MNLKYIEKEWGEYLGTKFNVTYPNGTMSLQVAMYAAGVRRGHEVICPSITYWASVLQSFNLGATPVFADIDPHTLCIDPDDIERHISSRTKAIMVVHYAAYPCEMDEILSIARKHNLMVIEDVSHAHGSLYKGRKVGALGDVAGMSMMSGKSFAIGEGGMLSTNHRSIYESAIAYANYIRHDDIEDFEKKKFAGLPWGAMKGRLNQICAAMGRVQLRHYPRRIERIQSAINRFWDLLKDTPGLHPHRPAKDSGSTMGGWYHPLGHYDPEALGGLPVEMFTEAVKAEGAAVGTGSNFPLHLHPVMNDLDVYGDGRPTRLAFASRDVRQPVGSLPVAEGIQDRTFGIPYFKYDCPEIIEAHAMAFRKVALQAEKLLS